MTAPDVPEQRLIADTVAVRAALQACWDEYHELMPDALYEQVKAALAVRVFTATPIPQTLWERLRDAKRGALIDGQADG